MSSIRASARESRESIAIDSQVNAIKAGTPGLGPDMPALMAAGDTYQANAQANIIDAKVLTAIPVAAISAYGQGSSGAYTLKGMIDRGWYRAGVSFLDEARGGASGALCRGYDQNLSGHGNNGALSSAAMWSQAN